MLPSTAHSQQAEHQHGRKDDKAKLEAHQIWKEWSFVLACVYLTKLYKDNDQRDKVWGGDMATAARKRGVLVHLVGLAFKWEPPPLLWEGEMKKY